MSSCVLSLAAASGAGVALAGGKALGLADLIAAGCDVPEGFVITTRAYRAQFERLAPGLRDAGPAAVRAALREAPLADDLNAAVLEAWRGLGGGRDGPRVAVRSSATLEDLADASFAGQYETTLGVRDADALARAVRQCWASLWGERAVAYRRRLGIPDADAALAVVVQVQVEADVAGVLFTVDPVEGGDTMLVSAAHGLGEVVVSGLVTPDTFHIDRDGRPRRAPLLGHQEYMLVAGVDGVERRDVPAGRRERPCLNAAQLAELARLARRLEQRAGTALDLEWAYAGARLRLLQARAVTRVPFVEPAPRAPRGLRRAFLRRLAVNFSDHFPEPLRPLDFTTVVRAALLGIGEALRALGLRMAPPERICAQGPRGESRFTPRPPRPTLALLGLPPRLRRLWRADLEAEWRAVDTPFLAERFAAFERGPLPALTDRALAELIALMQDTLERTARRRFRVYFLPGLLHTFALARLTRLAVGREAARTTARLLGGLDHHMDELYAALEGLARRALQEPALAARLRADPAEDLVRDLRRLPGGEAFARDLEAFLARHGDRPARGMVPVPGFPTWRERPAVVLSLLQALLREPASLDAAGRAAARRREAEDSARRVRAALARGLRGRLGLARAFEHSLRQARSFVRVRDASLRAGESGTARAREAALEAGRRLARAGLLRDLDDVFLLRFDELCAALVDAPEAAALAPRLALRRAQFEGWERRARDGRNWFPPLLGLERDAHDEARARGDDGLVRGLGASAGLARGPVRLVRSQDEFHRLRAGDVLVCPATAPAWTPLFTLCAAVVTDIGGPLSHAAIVAREYGLPAVLGTVSATRLLRDGEPVEVDGTRGQVRRLGPAAASAEQREREVQGGSREHVAVD